jgi:hypothetical protein
MVVFRYGLELTSEHSPECRPVEFLADELHLRKISGPFTCSCLDCTTSNRAWNSRLVALTAERDSLNDACIVKCVIS